MFMFKSQPFKLQVNQLRCFSNCNVNFKKYRTIEETLKSLPKNSNIIQVVSSIDFPLGFNKELLRSVDPSRITYVVSKIDSFFNLKYINNSEKFDQDKNLKIFREFFWQVCKSSNVIITGRSNYGIDELVNLIKNKDQVYHIIGDVNSGKSSIIYELIKKDEPFLENFEINLKLSGDSINGNKNGNKISNTPTITSTKDIIELKNLRAKIVEWDNYYANENGSIYGYIDKNALQYNKLATGSGKLINNKLINLNRASDKEVICLFNNMICLNKPAGIHYKDFKIFNCLPINDQIKPMKLSKFLSDNKDIKYKIFKLPRFHGRLDVVINGFGYFTIYHNTNKSSNGSNTTSTSDYENYHHVNSEKDKQHLFEVCLPEHVEAICRKGIVEFIGDMSISKPSRLIKFKAHHHLTSLNQDGEWRMPERFDS
ncbi:unnamed protein product [[Candida] boidinii]|uniref:Unnamed protein product n=1 Tax=Candida boidinii TaxID=5477 RepID=A0ACB5TGB7_CANBO|nr:unnamed protein product [[Candida] boidinii]